MSDDNSHIDLTGTYVLKDSEIVDEPETLELTGLVHQLTEELLASESEDEDDLDEEE